MTPAEPALKPLAGRECGECNVCCVAFLIDEPPVRKLPNVVCEHWNGGCGIYETRPHTCRAFFCGWRLFSDLPASWRPDRANIVILPLSQKPRLSAAFQLLGPLTQAVTLELVHTISAMIAGGATVYLVIGGAVGESANRVLLNDDMAPAIASRDIEQALAALENAIRRCTTYPRTPIALDPPGT